MKFSINQKDYSYQPPQIDRWTRDGSCVKWGRNNLFPQEILDVVAQSPLQTAILENKIKYILGAGLKDYDASIFTPNLQEEWFDLIHKCTRDFVYFGGFAILAVLNQSETTFSFYHQPFDTVRVGQYNEFNQIEKYYICHNWGNASKKNIVEVDAFGSEQPQKGKTYMLYFKPYKPNEYYYPQPSYANGLNWIMADAALSKYYNNFIRNNFSSNLAFKFPMEVEDEKKAEIYESLIESFGGSENAGNILLLFGADGTVPEITNIESVNSDLYNSVCDTVLKYIVSANRLTSPILAGLATSAGFSSKLEELVAAYSLYKITTIDESRSFIINKINYLLQLNGYPKCLELQDYDFVKETEGLTKQNDEIESSSNNTDSEATSTEEQLEEGRELK